MPLQDIVNVTITTSGKGVTRAGFGVAMIAAYHTNYVDRSRAYTLLSDIVADGFTVYSPAYKAAAKIFGQTPRPETLKIGRRALPFSQAIDLKPTDITVGLVYSVVVTSPDGTETTVTYTVQTSDTVALIVDALVTALDAITDLSCADSTTHAACTADNAGEMFFFNSPNKELELTDVTADPGIATDLAAIELADPTWYGLCLDSNSEAEIKAAQIWVEAQEKIAAYHSIDAGIKDSGVSDDVMSDLKALAYVRCVPLYSRHHDGYGGAAWLGRMFPQNPGRSTWAYKTLTGVAVDELNTTEAATIKGKNCNIYNEVAGLNLTEDGRTPDGIFIDIVRGRDWFTARLRERTVTLMANTLKVPYTTGGVDMVVNLLEAQFEEAIDPAYAYVAKDPPHIITPPIVANASAADRANRLLPDVLFEGTLQGAVHKVGFTGVLAV